MNVFWTIRVIFWRLTYFVFRHTSVRGVARLRMHEILFCIFSFRQATSGDCLMATILFRRPISATVGVHGRCRPSPRRLLVLVASEDSIDDVAVAFRDRPPRLRPRCHTSVSFILQLRSCQIGARQIARGPHSLGCRRIASQVSSCTKFTHFIKPYYIVLLARFRSNMISNPSNFAFYFYLSICFNVMAAKEW